MRTPITYTEIVWTAIAVILLIWMIHVW